jgi:hypothetical protein
LGLKKARLDDEYVEYFYWLVGWIKNDIYDWRDYEKVLWKLFDTRFVASLDRDRNRIEDALDLRTKFIPWNMSFPVSILEIMISMAIRIEDQIMVNTSDRDRTSDWFWLMMQNLGLRQQSDDLYDGDEYVDNILHDFNNRKYKRNGMGGLFVTTDQHQDMRKMELWYQMHAQFNDILQHEGYLKKGVAR